MGAEKFYLRRSQIRKREKIGLNQCLMFIHPFTLLSRQFLFSVVQVSKIFLVIKNSRGTFAPPCPSTQVTPMVLAALLQPAIGVTHPTFVHENATSL
jgi:hypothetical protein